MQSGVYEWDDAKAASNLHKHRVSFIEAISVFDDPYVVLEEDSEHSIDEHRALAIGFSSKSRVLLVVYVERVERIRIVSARKPTAEERGRYESQFGEKR